MRWAPPEAGSAQPQAAVDENVQFTVFRPRELVPDEWQPLLAFTHLASERSDVEVKRQAEAVLKHAIAEYRQVVQDAQDAVPRDEVLTLVPKVPGVEFEPAERDFPCRGTVHLEMFLARALPQLPAQTARGNIVSPLRHARDRRAAADHGRGGAAHHRRGEPSILTSADGKAGSNRTLDLGSG